MKTIKFKQTFKFLAAIALSLTLGVNMTSCSDDDDDAPAPVEANILSFKVTNAGQSGDVSVDGAINGKAITIAVPYETDVTKLIGEVVVSEGATVTPNFGTELDFSEARNFVVSNGDAENIYSVNVTKADPDSAVLQAIQFSSVSTGEDYETVVDLISQTVTVTYNTLQSNNVVVKSIEYGPNGAVSSLKAEDELDLAVSDLVITISFGGEDKVYDVVTEVTSAGFDADKTVTFMDKSSLAGLVPSEIADNASRGADYNGQYVFVPSRTNGNHIYYYDVTASVFEAKELSMTNVSGGTWAISDVKTVGEAIYACNMVMAASEKEFKVYKWDNINDEEPEVVLSFMTTNDKQRLGDALSIVGDPAAGGYIMASNFPGYGGNADVNEIFTWKATTGTLGDVNVWNVERENGGKIGQYGRVNAVLGTTDKFIVTGAESLLIVDDNGNVIYEVAGEVIQGRAHDASIFEYNGGRYLTYTVNRDWQAEGAFYEVVNITEGADAIEGIKVLTADNIQSKTVYKKMFSGPQDPWVSANNAVVFDSEGNPQIFAFTVMNGFIIETLNR